MNKKVVIQDLGLKDYKETWDYQERLFQESRFGQRLQDEIDAASAALARENREIEAELLPLVNEGKVEFATVSEILDLYDKNEACLDLQDGQDLSVYLP